jgi:4-amino-4-deoxy-L-arabinose transferase-like glycosyltransferase
MTRQAGIRGTEAQQADERLRPSLPLPAHSLLVLILLLAASLRIYGLINLSPPGLEHDEVANWLIDRSILEGNHAIYFTTAYGHEAAFHYLQATFVALIGDHALALRLPAVFSGIMLVAVAFALARRLFGQRVALFSAALLAVLFWPVFYSRLGLRAISLPLLSGLSAYFWWRAWLNQDRPSLAKTAAQSLPASSARRDFLIAGLLAGLSFHTYMAARALPIFYGLFTLYLAWMHLDELKRRKQGILLFWMAYALMASPLLIYLQTHPGSEFRISEIDAPLRAMTQGDLRPVLQNGLKLLGMFGFAGDPLWRQNVAGSPVFDPIVATLFYLSLPLALSHLSDSRYAFLLLWLMTSAIPSLITIDAPSSIRIINTLPILTILPALVIHILSRLSTVMHWLSTRCTRLCSQLGAAILFLYLIVLTQRALFHIWPQNEEVQFVWQAALTNAATYLDSAADTGPVAIGGWTPSTMDPPTMRLSLRRDDLKLSFFNPESTLILPASGSSQTVRILRPTILELQPILAEKLAFWGASARDMNGFTLYTLPGTPSIVPRFPSDALFGDQLRFMGYDLLSVQPASIELITYWRVAALADGPRRLYLRLMDQDGRVAAEEYSLDASDLRSQNHWQPGDNILQHHTLRSGETLSAGMAEPIELLVGVYDPNSCPPLPCNNLLTGEGAEFIQLQVDSGLWRGQGQ